MPTDTAPLSADHDFFTALIKGDVAALQEILVDDFVLVDVMQGAEVDKNTLLAVVGSGQIQFDVIIPAECHARLYDDIAVVNGRTLMRGRLGDMPFTTRSRYTHVFLEQNGQWRLASAQGTSIPGDGPACGLPPRA
jgi:ketosteroid isomerase-like protein